MEDWVLTSEKDFYDCMLEDWLDGEWAVYWAAREVALTRQELGGVAGQIGVMVDGAYVKFPDAVPEMKNGRTMVPCRPVLEAFGGQVRYEDGQAVCQLEGKTLRFRIGTTEATITDAAGTTEPIAMDAASYYHNGRTYLPVRFFAEALGCDVLWDSAYQTAVVLRRDKLIAELDSQFTVMNRMLAALSKRAEGNTKTVMTLDGKLTVLDSINGDKTYNMGAKATVLQSGSVLDITAQMDLSALAEILGELSSFEMSQLKALLKNARAEVLYDGQEGMLYLKMTGLSKLTYGMYDDSSWLAMPVPALSELEDQGAVSVGALLYTSEVDSAEGGCPALLCRDMRDGAKELAESIGDGCFTQQGDWSVLSYDKEDYMADLTRENGPAYALYSSEFEKLDLELKIARSGSAAFRLLMQNKGKSLTDQVFLVDASGSATPAKVDMKLLVRMKNVLDLELRYAAVTEQTREEPRRKPPEGASVISVQETPDLPELSAGKAAEH